MSTDLNLLINLSTKFTNQQIRVRKIEAIINNQNNSLITEQQLRFRLQKLKREKLLLQEIRQCFYDLLDNIPFNAQQDTAQF